MEWPTCFTPEVQQGLLKPFPEQELEWKLQARSKDGSKGMAVCYVDARAVMRRLDQVVGNGNWSFDFDAMNAEGTMIKGKLSVYGVTKCDIGQHTGGERDEIEKGKSAVSDALKRCAVHFGIGRFLYRLDRKWVPLNERKEMAETPRLTLREITEACRAVGYEGDLGTDEKASGSGSVQKPAQSQRSNAPAAGQQSRARGSSAPVGQQANDRGETAGPVVEGSAADPPVAEHWCAGCGMQIKGTTKRPAAEVARLSRELYGAELCVHCVQEKQTLATANVPTGAIAA